MPFCKRQVYFKFNFFRISVRFPRIFDVAQKYFWNTGKNISGTQECFFFFKFFFYITQYISVGHPVKRNTYNHFPLYAETTRLLLVFQLPHLHTTVLGLTMNSSTVSGNVAE